MLCQIENSIWRGSDEGLYIQDIVVQQLYILLCLTPNNFTPPKRVKGLTSPLTLSSIAQEQHILEVFLTIIVWSNEDESW